MSIHTHDQTDYERPARQQRLLVAYLGSEVARKVASGKGAARVIMYDYVLLNIYLGRIRQFDVWIYHLGYLVTES